MFSAGVYGKLILFPPVEASNQPLNVSPSLEVEGSSLILLSWITV